LLIAVTADEVFSLGGRQNSVVIPLDGAAGACSFRIAILRVREILCLT
jgi:hypothetical protein